MSYALVQPPGGGTPVIVDTTKQIPVRAANTTQVSSQTVTTETDAGALVDVSGEETGTRTWLIILVLIVTVLLVILIIWLVISNSGDDGTNGGIVTPGGLDAVCSSSSECEGTLTCEANRCKIPVGGQGCTTTLDCISAAVCSQGLCIIDPPDDGVVITGVNGTNGTNGVNGRDCRRYMGTDVCDRRSSSDRRRSSSSDNCDRSSSDRRRSSSDRRGGSGRSMSTDTTINGVDAFRQQGQQGQYGMQRGYQGQYQGQYGRGGTRLANMNLNNITAFSQIGVKGVQGIQDTHDSSYSSGKVQRVIKYDELGSAHTTEFPEVNMKPFRRIVESTDMTNATVVSDVSTDNDDIDATCTESALYTLNSDGTLQILNDSGFSYTATCNISMSKIFSSKSTLYGLKAGVVHQTNQEQSTESNIIWEPVQWINTGVIHMSVSWDDNSIWIQNETNSNVTIGRLYVKKDGEFTEIESINTTEYRFYGKDQSIYVTLNPDTNIATRNIDNKQWLKVKSVFVGHTGSVSTLSTSSSYDFIKMCWDKELTFRN